VIEIPATEFSIFLFPNLALAEDDPDHAKLRIERVPRSLHSGLGISVGTSNNRVRAAGWPVLTCAVSLE